MYVVRRVSDRAFKTRDNSWSVPVIKRSPKTGKPIGYVDTSDLARFTQHEAEWIVLDGLYHSVELEAIKLADIKWEELDSEHGFQDTASY